MEQINSAISLLTAIGGTAMLVAGVGRQYWADAQTQPRKQKLGAGQYGRNLREHFARERMKMQPSLRGKNLT